VSTAAESRLSTIVVSEVLLFSVVPVQLTHANEQTAIAAINAKIVFFIIIFNFVYLIFVTYYNDMHKKICLILYHLFDFIII